MCQRIVPKIKCVRSRKKMTHIHSEHVRLESFRLGTGRELPFYSHTNFDWQLRPGMTPKRNEVRGQNFTRRPVSHFRHTLPGHGLGQILLKSRPLQKKFFFIKSWFAKQLKVVINHKDSISYQKINRYILRILSYWFLSAFLHSPLPGISH